MNIKAVIVDDEFLARQRILKLLEDDNEVEIIAECKNGEEAVETINSKEPDLVFLDIQMPDLDGFAVLSQLHTKNNPHIIFATAFDQYAVDAFKVHAVDYLLKPFDEDRFNESLVQAKEHLKLKEQSKFNEKLLGLMREFQQTDDEFLTTFEIKDRGRMLHVPSVDIHYLEANGNYITLHTADGNWLYRATMNAVESELNPKEFLRIHRSLILNKRYIRKYQYISNNEYKFQLKDRTSLISSRSYKEKIAHYISHS